MKFIDTKMHGVLDYVVGLLLIAAPWLLKFYKDGAESWVPISLGVAAILYSFFTNYELGVNRIIPMRTHLWFDFISGVVLASSPWLFGFSGDVYLPHLLLGIFEIAAAVLTKTTPGTVDVNHQHEDRIRIR